MIVFCGTRYKAEDMAKELAALHGRESVRFYHAGMEKEERKAVEDWFFSSDGGMLCATCAYGMGVDKGDVRTIVHLESPSTVEEYMQESGRAGRDGKASSAILLWSPMTAGGSPASPRTAGKAGCSATPAPGHAGGRSCLRPSAAR